MFINAITKVAILVLAAVGVISAMPLEVRDHEDFEYKMLQATNWYRSQHGANALSWDRSLADYAANHASYCTRDHSGGPYGENMVFGDWSSTAAWVDSFGHERVQFDFDNGSADLATGHFTQLVWKATSEMGCGWAKCGDIYHVICEYQPRGNVADENNHYYRENVGFQTWGSIDDQFES
ncbi:hypothetical protein ARSEF4850_004278 [Beauveria asiatica]